MVRRSATFDYDVTNNRFTILTQAEILDHSDFSCHKAAAAIEYCISSRLCWNVLKLLGFGID